MLLQEEGQTPEEEAKCKKRKTLEEDGPSGAELPTEVVES